MTMSSTVSACPQFIRASHLKGLQAVSEPRLDMTEVFCDELCSALVAACSEVSRYLRQCVHHILLNRSLHSYADCPS
jgi:hypothetical protein